MSRKNTIKILVAIVVFAITVFGIYFRITRSAEPGLAGLPDGIMAQSGDFSIAQTELEAHLAGLPEKQRELAAKDLEGTLDEMIQRRLLLTQAKKLPEGKLPDIEGMKEAKAQAALIKALKNDVTKDTTASEKEIKEYYEEHRTEYEGREGGSYDEMRDSIEKYIVYEKGDALFRGYVEELKQTSGVVKNRAWVLEVRSKIIDPLEDARKSGKVLVADFGRGI